ncbi:two-component system response regulator [Chryseomicrobium excrementi]|uniref:Two-component system response regulator n=1 Tax=Chryseomicrobium excrementi TaxID=2041346 RepID=A0A2M9F039_9BACL|nr:two-component system response regulator [Chryseomicrobium excrementi]
MTHLLIVDDQMGIRMLLQEVFEQSGYTVSIAANGEEALEMFRAQQVDGVLLDMKIPGMNGIEILKHMKREKPDVPVMMMTAYGELNLIEEAKELGAALYFTKPFDIFEVRSAVIEQLQAS